MHASHSFVVGVVLFAASSSAPLGSDPSAVFSLAELSLLGKKRIFPVFMVTLLRNPPVHTRENALKEGAKAARPAIAEA